MDNKEFMSQFKEISKEEYEAFLKNKKTTTNLFMEWYDHYDAETNEIIARDYMGKYYILKEEIPRKCKKKTVLEHFKDIEELETGDGPEITVEAILPYKCEQVEKELEVFEITREKNVDMYLFKQARSLKEYNHWVSKRCKSYGQLTQEEFDLLKEMLGRMSRLTDRNYKNTTLPLESCKPYLKLGRLEDLEDKIGCELEKVIGYIENGFTDNNGVFHKQVYLAYIDNKWCICDLKTDEWFLVSEVLEC